MVDHSHMGQMSGSMPSFTDMWSPLTMLITLILIAAYFYIVGPMRNKFADSQPVGFKQKFYFVSAAVLFYISEGSPVAYYSHGISFSVHMTEMAIFYLMVPPLFYLSIPDWLARSILEPRRKWLYPLTQPLLAIVLFNMAFSIYHMPAVFAITFQHMALHMTYHYVLAVLAFQMWFPIYCPLPEWNRLSGLQKIAYIFANGVLITPACALIMFSNSLMYPEFTLPLSWKGHLDQLGDQQLGGIVMKILQEIIYGSALTYTFFKWYHSERKKEQEDELNELGSSAIGDPVGPGHLNGA